MRSERKNALSVVFPTEGRAGGPSWKNQSLKDPKDPDAGARGATFLSLYFPVTCNQTQGRSRYQTSEFPSASEFPAELPARALLRIQGYLTYKKTHPPRNIP
jgi:hypothetical protein